MAVHAAILSVDCCDGRMSRCGNGYGGAFGDGWNRCKCPGLTKGQPAVRVYSLSSPGPRVSESVIQDVVTMLRGGFGIGSVRLITHSDCGASKLECGLPVDRALEADEAAKVEARTEARRDEAVALLLANDSFVASLQDGKRPFRVGHWSIAEQMVVWLLEFDHASGTMKPVPADRARIECDSPSVDATVEGEHVAH